MKALLMKDLHILWRRMKLFLLVILILAFVPGVFQGVFAITYASMVPYSVFSVDEASKWDRLAAMLPYSVTELVLSKYILGWLCAGGAFVAAAAGQGLIGTAGAPAAPFGVLVQALCISLLVIDLTLPVVFRWGVERARMTTVLIVAAVCGSAAALSSLLEEGVIGGFGPGTLALLAATAAATALSVKCSFSLYKKREM